MDGGGGGVISGQSARMPANRRPRSLTRVCSRSMREDIAGARARRRQQQPADAVCVINRNGHRRDA